MAHLLFLALLIELSVLRSQLYRHSTQLSGGDVVGHDQLDGCKDVDVVLCPLPLPQHHLLVGPSTVSVVL